MMNILCFLLTVVGVIIASKLFGHSSANRERARTTSRYGMKEGFEIRSQNYALGAAAALIVSILIAVLGMFLTMTRNG